MRYFPEPLHDTNHHESGLNMDTCRQFRDLSDPIATFEGLFHAALESLLPDLADAPWYVRERDVVNLFVFRHLVRQFQDVKLDIGQFGIEVPVQVLPENPEEKPGVYADIVVWHHNKATAWRTCKPLARIEWKNISCRTKKPAHLEGQHQKDTSVRDYKGKLELSLQQPRLRRSLVTHLSCPVTVRPVTPLEIDVHCMLVPFDGANLAVDHLRQTRFNVVGEPADDEAGEVGSGVEHGLAASQADHEGEGRQFSFGHGLHEDTAATGELIEGSVRQPPDDLGADGVCTPGIMTERREGNADFLDVYVSTAVQVIFETAMMWGEFCPNRKLRRRILFVSCHGGLSSLPKDRGPTFVVSMYVVHSCSPHSFHCARKPVRDEASTLGVPFVAVVAAYPLAVRVAVLADENGARSGAVDVAAVASHVWFVDVLHPLEIVVHRVPLPLDIANLALDQFRQTGVKVIG